MTLISGKIICPNGIISGTLDFNQDIQKISASSTVDDFYIFPGFIDLHIHGSMGADVMQGKEEIMHTAASIARFGCTTFLPTSYTMPKEATLNFLLAVKDCQNNQQSKSAHILGAHMEGPFINPQVLGAQPPHAATPDRDFLRLCLNTCSVPVITLAPEIPGMQDLYPLLQAQGVKIQIGHSAASIEELITHEEKFGLKFGYTHLGNAMTGFHHRQAGIMGHALAYGTYAEVITDFIHVSEHSLKAINRAMPLWYAITDAVSAAGMPDGTYELGRKAIHKKNDIIRQDDGSLAGSALTMDLALKKLIKLGLDPIQCAKRLSTYAAMYLGLEDRGQIQIGKRADLVVTNTDFEIQQVYIQGQKIL